ncbi:MAG: flippase [Bacteroidota bacterium]|nr:flippase [Bacteroidota bacterium]
MPSPKSKDVSSLYSGRAVAKNTVYNLLGYGIPLVVAVVLIPPLIKGLGEERFGILNLAWVVIGYFSFFDFGIGRSLTKIIAEKIGTNRLEDIPGIFWTSFFLMAVVSLIGTLILVIVTPSLVNRFFHISQELQPETADTLYALAFSIPIVTTTAGLRGVLEAYQKFSTANVIKIILGVFTFLGPLFCLIFTKSLFWIVVFLILVRVIVWYLYLLQCFKINGEIRRNFKFDSTLIRPVLKLSGWMTVSNVVGPLITYLDRFLIGALISAIAITYYATPYEVVTKLLLVPSAIVGVLFPVFSGSSMNNPEFSKKLLQRSSKYIFLCLFPVVMLTIIFSNEILTIWVGKRFGENSSIVLQLLVIGVLLNSIAYVPFSFLQGIGRPDIPAKINLIELPLYITTMWFAVKIFGINGAALVLLLLNTVNTILQIYIVNKLVASAFEYKLGMFWLIFIVVAVVVPFVSSDLLVKVVFAMGILVGFLFFAWRYFLPPDEKIFFVNLIKKQTPVLSKTGSI